MTYKKNRSVCCHTMTVLPLSQTSSAPPRLFRGGYFLPVNVASSGVACTINTRYDGMQLPEDILSLAHYPKTVILIEYSL